MERRRVVGLIIGAALLGLLSVIGLAKKVGRTEAIGGPDNTATIPLRPGWNLISFNMFPSDTTPASVIAPLNGQYDVVMGFDGVGQSYYPGVPPSQQTLKRMDPLHGYWIKARDYVTLTIQGSLVPSDTRIPQRAGWNLIPYLPTQSMALTQALQTVAGYYRAVLGFDRGAQSYYMQIPARMNTLHDLQPGRGYWLYVDQDTYLTYGPTPPILGAQTFGELINEEARNRARSAGIHWPRMDIAWSRVEPNPPVGTVHTYDWESRYDSLIGAMFQFGWRDPVLTIKEAPEWAVDSYSAPWDDDNNDSTPNVQYLGGPIDDEDLPNFDAFLSALVSRYAPDGDWAKQRGFPPGVGVRYWEIYNEPDNKRLDSACAAVGGLWGDEDLDADGVPDAQEYAELLRRAYPIIKAANPQAQVVFGGLAYDVIPEDCFNMDFLEQVLTYLQTNYASEADYPFFDLLSFHQYDLWRDSWDGTEETATLPFNQGLLAKAVQSNPAANYPGYPHYPAIREVLAAHGLDDIPLIASEVSLYSDRSTDNDELQSRHAVHEYVRAMTLWSDKLFAVMWFTLQNYDYGLLELNTAVPYQVYYAYKGLGQELDGYRFETQLGPEAPSAGGTGSSYVQAYRFQHTDGRRKLVLWTDDGKPLHGWESNKAQDVAVQVQLGPLQLGQSITPPLTLRVTDSTSYPTLTAQTIVDGGAGDEDSSQNGWVTLTVTQDPVYIEVIAP